ncbi:MAG: hypothetical protein ABL879_17465, partial [Devosia sp.]
LNRGVRGSSPRPPTKSGILMFRNATLTEAQIAAIRVARERRFAMAKRRGAGKRINQFIQAVVGFTLVGLLRLMPLDQASGLAGWIGEKVLARSQRNEKIERTMRVPFPNLTDEELWRLTREMSGNVMRVFAELAHLRAFTGTDNPRFRISGLENIEAAKTGGRGVLFSAGHFGNWETSEIILRNLGLDGAVSIMPPTNPFVFGWLARQRYSVGLSEQVGAGEGVYRTLSKTLRDGRIALMLADQRVGNGIKVPFFGVETVTNVLPAWLARRTKVAVVPLSIRRVADARVAFDVAFRPALRYEATGNPDADDVAFMSRINAFYEDEVRAVPEQWLWGHPRWDDAIFGLQPKRIRGASAAVDE